MGASKSDTSPPKPRWRGNHGRCGLKINPKPPKNGDPNPIILWMDEILHHLRNPGSDDSPINTKKYWFQPWCHFAVRNEFRNHPQCDGVWSRFWWLWIHVDPISGVVASPFGLFIRGVASYCGWTKSCTTLKPWLKPVFVGIYR